MAFIMTTNKNTTTIQNTLPNVSTVGNFLMIAFRLAILKIPRARVTVTTIGKPSGIAATAKL